MISRARSRLRSWMFIYAGLAAAILLAGQPAQGDAQPELHDATLPGIENAPLLRRDI